jgi:hypothetical protein
MRFTNNDFQALTNLSGRLCHTRLGLTIEGRNQIIECLSQLHSKNSWLRQICFCQRQRSARPARTGGETSAREIPAIQEQDQLVRVQHAEEVMERKRSRGLIDPETHSFDKLRKRIVGLQEEQKTHAGEQEKHDATIKARNDRRSSFSVLPGVLPHKEYLRLVS